MNAPIRISIADDHSLFREGLARLLSEQVGFEVLWLAEDGNQTLGLLKNEPPDILLLDIQMHGMNGIQTLEQLQKQGDKVKTIILSMHQDKPYVQRVVELGAMGYLLKNAGNEELVRAISQVAAGGRYYSSEVTHSLIQSPQEDAVKLTPRELEVLRLIAEEYNNPDIAEKLFLSVETVNSHRKNLLKKLDVKNTAGLVRYAIQNKLV